MWRVSQHPDFDAIFNRVKFELLLAWGLALLQGRAEAQLEYGFRCRQGRHRSVALAELTAAALVEMGCAVEVEHHSLGGYFRPRCGCPGACTISAVGPGTRRDWAQVI